jgi:hypothetical protein
MKPALYLRPLTDEEHVALATGLRSQDAFSMRRCQIWRASAKRQKPAAIAKTLHCAPPTVRHVLHACHARGIACVRRGSHVPLRVEPVLNAEKREQVRAILHQSPRTFGQPARGWTLKRLATVCYEQGVSDTTRSCPTMLDAIGRLGGSWSRATHWSVSPDPASERKNNVGTASSSWPRSIQTSCWASKMTWGGAVKPSPRGMLGATISPAGWWKRRGRPRTQRAQLWRAMDAMCQQSTRCGYVLSRDVPSAGSPAPFWRGLRATLQIRANGRYFSSGIMLPGTCAQPCSRGSQPITGTPNRQGAVA